MAASVSASARRRAAQSGTSAISRAIALRSTMARCDLRYSESQVSMVARQRGGGDREIGTEPQQHRQLQIAIRLLDAARGFRIAASDNLPHDGFCTPTQLCVGGAHMHHQAAVDAP